MNSINPGLIIAAIAGGTLGALAMNAFMYAISNQANPRVNMAEALGSLITKRLEGASRIGHICHLAIGILFGLLYAYTLAAAGATALPQAIFLGMALGLFQGIIISYCLMFIVSEKHPIEKYRRATLQTGALHLLGHILYGAVVGLLVGLLA